MSGSTNNSQKTPFVATMSRFVERAADVLSEQQGMALPCVVTEVSGSIVTVSFQVAGQTNSLIPTVEIPIFGPEYIRYPIQPGCKGVALSADAYLGGMSGLGGGVADLVSRSNLSSLVFFPIGNTNFPSVNGQVLTMYGPGGVTLMDQGQTTFVNLTPGQIELTAGGHSFVVNSSGVAIDGLQFGTHEHTGVQTGGGKTGGPVAP